jgi:hypothetical protein
MGFYLFFWQACSSWVSSVAHAQYEDGSLVGTIRDSSGAVVSGAAVSVTNTATGIVERVTTSGDGDYEFPSLRTGIYDHGGSQRRGAAAGDGFSQRGQTSRTTRARRCRW